MGPVGKGTPGSPASPGFILYSIDLLQFSFRRNAATMTAKGHHDPVSVAGDEKAVSDHLEKTSYVEESLKPTLENVDHTGAVAKTDPVEIALVRKIDWRLMVRSNLF